MAAVGAILRATPAVWVNDPPVEREGTVSALTATSLTLDAGASSVPGYYVGMWVVVIIGTDASSNFVQPYAQITGYNATTKVISFASWTNGTPSSPAGKPWRIVKDYPLIRTFQWKRNGVAITGQTSLTYTTQNADAGTQITVTETAGRISPSNDGVTLETPTATSSATSAPVTISAGTTDAELVYQNNLSYVGTFKIPGAGSGNASFPFFSDGAISVRDNGGTKTLIVRAHTNALCAGEVSLSVTPSTSGDYTSMNATTMVYPASTLTDLPDLASGVNIAARGAGAYNLPFTGLHCIAGNKMLFNRLGWLDTGTLWTHFRRPVDLSDQTAGNVEGPFFVMDPTYQASDRWTAGWYCDIPSAWQSALGGDVLCGQGGPYYSSASQALNSHGPSACAIDTTTIDAAIATIHSGTAQGGSSNTIQLASGASASDGYYVGHYVYAPSAADTPKTITGYVGATRTATISGAFTSSPTASTTYRTIPYVSGRQLVGYANTDPLVDSSNIYGTFSPVWNFTANHGGMCIPNGTRSLLCFAKVGQGLYGYAQPNLTSTQAMSAGIRLYDPPTPYPGPHAYPATIKVYCYDLDDLAAVKANSIAFNAVRPYAVLSLTIPAGLTSTDGRTLRGVSYNAATKHVYLCEVLGATATPVVHVFSVSNAV